MKSHLLVPSISFKFYLLLTYSQINLNSLSLIKQFFFKVLTKYSDFVWIDPRFKLNFKLSQLSRNRVLIKPTFLNKSFKIKMLLNPNKYLETTSINFNTSRLLLSVDHSVLLKLPKCFYYYFNSLFYQFHFNNVINFIYISTILTLRNNIHIDLQILVKKTFTPKTLIFTSPRSLNFKFL